MKFKHALLGAVVLMPAMAQAGANTQTGTLNGRTFTATSRIIGQTPTGNATPSGQLPVNPGGGNPIYLANNRNGYSGVVGMLMTYSNGDRFVCSGSLLSGGKAIATAAHCVSKGGGVKAADLVKTEIFFQNDASSDLDERVYGIPLNNLAPGVTKIEVDAYKVRSGYTGQVIDQNDIAILRLSELAPAYAQQYSIFAGNELKGQQFNVAGYGTRSAVGGAEGNSGLGAGAGTGWRRQGDNNYDFRLGDAAFGGFWDQPNPNRPGSTNFFGTAEIDYSYLSDFDNGLAANDASCLLGSALGAGTQFCNTGLGAREVNIAGGDSGGGAFINGQLASINSYGLSFGSSFGDFKTGLNSSWGEFSGYVPTFIHRDWINSTVAAGVPEAATWMQMILGFGLVGGAIRAARRRPAFAAA